MIEKLNLEEVNNPGEATLKAFSILNQLVDAFNTIQKEREAERFEIQEWIGILESVRKSVNKHEDIIRQIGEWGSSKGECLWCENLTEVNLDDDEVQRYGAVARGFKSLRKEPADPYAEQRRWIGKLCKFWDNDGEGYIYEILIDIEDDGSDYPYKIVETDSKNWTLSYKHCEPVSEDLIYKGE